MLEAENNKCDNALILDYSENICETASGNVYWFKNSKLYTPENSLPFIEGTVQKKIFNLFNAEIIYGKFKLEDLKDADEVFMSNIGCLIAGISSIVLAFADKIIYESKSNDFTETLKLREKLLNLLIYSKKRAAKRLRR